MLENAKFSCVSRKKILNEISSFLGDVHRRLFDWGDTSRGVVLRKLLVGLTGFTEPLYCTTFDFMFRFWKFCSELRLFYILILQKKTDINLFAKPECQIYPLKGR